jgi:site-specific DNA recombinase
VIFTAPAVVETSDWRNPNLTGGTWVIYARLSKKKKGRRRNDADSVEEQIRQCREFAALHQLKVGKVYVDNHVSAWREDGERPAFIELMAAAVRGEFVGILLFKLDRFARNTPDAEALIKINEQRFIVIDGPKAGRINLRTAAGKSAFRVAAAAAAGESDNTSERSQSGMQARVRQGLLLGRGRIFGYEILSQVREYEDDVQPVQRKAEADAIREVAAKVLDGKTFTELAADLNKRGMLTARGNTWTSKGLSQMMASPRYGGYAIMRSHGVEVVGQLDNPILDADTYGQLQALLAGRRRGRQPAGRYQLTKILHCGNPKCGYGGTLSGAMSKRANGTVRQYTCSWTNGGCGMRIVAEPVERKVRAQVLKDYADVARIDAWQAEAAALADRRAEIDAAIGRIDQQLADLEVRRVTTGMRDIAYNAARAALDGMLATEKAKSDALPDDPPEAPAEAPEPLTAAELEAATPAQMQAMIRRLRLHVTVYPHPAGKSTKVFDPNRVDISSLEASPAVPA